jgi:selenocysteine lyase/cysteine desulfurase
MECLVPRTDFIGLDGLTHLYTAAEGPLPKVAAEAIVQYTQNKTEAEQGRRWHDEVIVSCRAATARLLGACAPDIAFLGSASEAISAVAGVLPFTPGDNVVVNDLEFMSVALPWMRLRSKGLEVRIVPHQDWTLPAESILAAVDERTALVALSHVSFVNGWRSDIACISAQLRGTRTKFLVDATQSAGIFPVDASLADFVISSTYKWLLGTHGLGILYVNPALDLPADPAAIGWYSIADASAPDRYERYTLKPGAGRFEAGYLNFPAIYALNASLGYLGRLDGADLAGHVHDLGDEIIDGLTDLGLTVTTPRDRDVRGASVTFLHQDATSIGEELASRDVHVWAGDGRVRASPNIYTSSADIETYLGALAGCLSS